MNISVIFTGGTIGSKYSKEGCIGPDTATHYRLIEQYKNATNPPVQEAICFSTYEPYEILSENLSAHNLLSLIHQIEQVLMTNPDGIIITHGTDTLAYTSSILSYVYANVSIPIVLVSSNYVLEDSRANGLINFTTAVEFIALGKYNGVYVSYKNQKLPPSIFHGNRIQQSLPYTDTVYATKDSYVGSFENHTFFPNLSMPQINLTEKPFINANKIQISSDTNKILRITTCPGMVYPTISDNVTVILHDSYHSGTIPITDGLKAFSSQARERKIPIYLVGLSALEHEYATVSQYKNLGVEPLPDCSMISQYCKLWLATSNNIDIKQVMHRCYAGEWLVSL